MAKQVLTNAHLTVNSVDLSDHVASITLNYAAEIQDVSAMGDGSRAKLPGLLDWSIDVEFRQDFAASEVDATLFSLVGASAFAIVLRPDAAAVSATNPEFTGNGLLASYPPIAGTLGEAHNVSVTIEGDGALARATS